MGKLIELLTEHCRKHYGFKDNDDIEIDTDSVSFHLYFKGERLFPIRVETVIYKEFGFIKWLVENDKIDRTFREDVKYPYYLEKGGLLQGYEKSEVILMLLSIQDEPISFLLSILK